MNLCLATLHTPSIAHWADKTARDKHNYCARHGYTCAAVTDTLEASRPPSWSKLPLIRRLLPDFDWVCWMDADMVITNPRQRLERFIDARPGGPDLIVGADPVSAINCGAMFVRNTPAAFDLLDRVWRQTAFINHGWWEQAAMWDLIKRGAAGPAKVSMPSRAPWNQFPHEWKHGDFAIHFAGRPDRVEMVEIFLAVAEANERERAGKPQSQNTPAAVPGNAFSSPESPPRTRDHCRQPACLPA